ncbi:hypothetical protein ACFY3U_15290 [Micromonospora sp. NPDC000089]|uniref:hypothetical protein n=1 Tax=unclassified Micromonospora TaxID=2617518 RepID=UPI0036AC7F95
MDDHDDESRAIRWGRRRFRLAFTGVGVLAGALGAIIAVTGGGDALFREGDPPGWLRVLGWVIAAAGLIIEIVALVRLVRNGWYRRNRQSPLWAVRWVDRNAMIKRVRRGGPVTDQELPLLRRLAEGMRGQVSAIWIQVGLVIFFAGQAFTRFTWFWLGFATLMAALFAVAWWQMRRDARLADAFLRAHPAPASPPSGGIGPGAGSEASHH